MCGIVGIWGRSDEKLIRDMAGQLAHRGPDAEGHFSQPQGTLGHRRLAIIDPARGNQPIHNEDRSKIIVANGEIYNYPSLVHDLRLRHTLRSRSDSEAILHLYEDTGTSVVDHLDGMFVFAIADGSRLFVARDPLGIKPLYYVNDEGTFLFASEIKVLCDWPRQIREFPPGHYLADGSHLKRYYEVPGGSPEPRSVENHIQKLSTKLEAAVAKRLRSDVPVGCFLSGGLDSSIVAFLARRWIPDLHTVCVGLAGSSDLLAAREVANHLGTVHHEHVLTAQDVERALPEIIYRLESFDVDLVRSAIPCYFAARLASKHFKVVLTGEGADELFAGYDYHARFPDGDSLQQELRESVCSLHNMNLQRVDRMTMAHSIEGRVPFLDTGLIQAALSVPTDYKIRGDQRTNKWILRRVAERWLPHEIIWRPKEQFDAGSGVTELLRLFVADFAKVHGVRLEGHATPRRLESRLYRHLYHKHFPPETDHLVARWRGSSAPTG